MAIGFRSAVIGTCVIAASVLTVLAAPQNAQAPAPPQEAQPVFRGGVELMNLSVTVTDKRGRSVTDLTKDDFIVSEDKQPQEILEFKGVKQSNETPIGLGLVLDASQSMSKDRLDSMRTAVHILLNERLRPIDEAYFIEFASDVRLITDWTSDRKSVVDAVRRIRTRQGTAIYNAIMQGLEVSSKGKHKKQVIVLITDGGDSHSTIKREQVAIAAARSDVIVYAIVVDAEEGFGRGGQGDTNLRQSALELGAVTDPTGGRTHYVQGFAGLEDAIDALGKDIRQQYELSYARPPADNRAHQIAVAVKRPDLTVRYRRVYVAD